MKKYIFIVVAFSFLLIVSCVTDETCSQSKYVKLTANFYHVFHNDTTKITTITSLLVDSFSVQGLKFDTTSHQYQLVDSILYRNSKGSTMNLPLNNFAPLSTFKLTFDTAIDTMTILHANMNDYLSLECGCIVTHAIDTVIITHHYIDSVRINIHNVNTINAENIRLYK